MRAEADILIRKPGGAVQAPPSEKSVSYWCQSDVDEVKFKIERSLLVFSAFMLLGTFVVLVVYGNVFYWHTGQNAVETSAFYDWLPS